MSDTLFAVLAPLIGAGIVLYVTAFYWQTNRCWYPNCFRLAERYCERHDHGMVKRGNQ